MYKKQFLDINIVNGELRETMHVDRRPAADT